jgi:tripartite-type tricarboxylate transporter receptor subunit TctC
MNRSPAAGSRRRAVLVAAAPLIVSSPWLVLASGAAHAETWPAKPLTIVVPFPPGGGTDAFARPLTATLGRVLNQRVIVDNRGGAGGNVGAQVAAGAAPDGYTWFMGAVHHTIAPSVYPKLDYSLKDNFVPVALISSVPQVIVVNAARVAARTLPDFLAHVRANPGKVNYASAGSGTSHHLAGELFKLQTKTYLIHIPYRGAGPALQDLITGQVDVMFDGLGSSAQHIKSGRLAALAVASNKRVASFSEIPTTAEGGVPTYRVATWYGLWAPRGTPQPAIDGMIAGLQKTFAAPEIKEMWAGLGSEIPTLTGRAYGDFVDAEIKRWAEVVNAANIKLE